MFRKMHLFLAAAFLAVGAVPLWAQTGTDEQTLPEVQVTGYGQFENKPFTEAQKATATNNIVYDSAALETSQAEVLSDFLAEQGVGVYKYATDYAHTLLTMRGFRTDHLSKELDGHVLFLIDGRRSGTNNATQIPLVNVARVEILRGPEMLKYGATAAGGVINVVTKKGGPDKLAGSLEAGFGSYDYKLGRLKLNGLADGFDYSLGYQYSEKGNYKDGKGDEVYNSKTDGVNSLTGNFGYTFNERHRIGWSTYYYDVDKAYRPTYVDDQFILWGPTYTNRYNMSNTVVYDGAAEDERFSWQAAYTFGENWSKQYSAGEDGNPMAAKFDRKIFDASLTYNGDIFNLTGGFQHLDYDTEEGRPAAKNPAGAVTSPGNLLAPTGSYEDTAGFLNGDLKLLEDTLIFSAALRYDHFKVSDKLFDPALDTINLPPGSPTPPRGQTYNHLSRSLGVSYLPLDQLKLRANYTNSMRPPSPRELTSASYEPYNFWGYPWNKAENTDTYEGGFDVNLRHLSFSATYFYSYTKDYVFQHNDPGVKDNFAPGTTCTGNSQQPTYDCRQRVRNSDRQRREGIEMQLSGNVASALGYDSFELRPYFNLSHLIRVEELYRRGYEGPLNYGKWTDAYGNWIPKTTIGSGLRFQHPGQKLKANLNFNYYGRTYFNPNAENVATGQKGGFTVANLSLRKGLWDFTDTQNLELKLDVNNLFNKDYVFDVPSPQDPNPYHMPGRNYYVGLAYNF